MKINLSTKCMVLGTKKNDYEFNGVKGVSYKAVCLTKDERGTNTDDLPITSEVFSQLEEMKQYELFGYVDSKYKKILIEGANLLK